MKIKTIVIINGVDKTSRITGNLIIDIEEGVARIATFSTILENGITDLLSWVGKSVVIKSVVNSIEKIEFTGIINTPKFNINTGLTVFNCTDNVQEAFETRTTDEIKVLIPNSYWSEAVFNTSEGWEYAQDRMSTLPSSLDYDAEKNIRITEWEAKATPDFIYNNCIEGSLNVDQIAERRNIINKQEIELSYRYTRLKERQLACDWDDGLSENQFVCDRPSPYPLPKKALILDAIDRTGWEQTQDVTWKELPDGSYSCSGNTVYFSGGTIWARGATFDIGKRYTQSVTELYKITVLASDSISGLGEIGIKKTYASQSEYSTEEWLNSLIKKGWAGYGAPSLDVNFDYYVNKDDDESRQNAITTAVNVASTKILSTHRQSKVSFTVPFDQEIDIIHTVKLTDTQLEAQGKVAQIVKTINMDQQNFEATTKIIIALSQKFGTGTPLPDNPAITPTALPTVPDDQVVETDLEYHLGGRDDTVFDENWSGWIVDYATVTEPGHTPYPEEFVIHTPAITLNSLDNLNPETESLYNVTIPDDFIE